MLGYYKGIGAIVLGFWVLLNGNVGFGIALLVVGCLMMLVFKKR